MGTRRPGWVPKGGWVPKVEGVGTQSLGVGTQNLGGGYPNLGVDIQSWGWVPKVGEHCGFYGTIS